MRGNHLGSLSYVSHYVADIDCAVGTRFGLKARRKLRTVPGAAEDADSSLAARELSFLVRLAQAAASTQRPDELLELIIREATSAMGTNVC